MGPNDSGKTQILQGDRESTAQSRRVAEPGRSLRPNGAMSEFADSLVDTLGRRRRPHRLQRRDIAQRFARRTHTLTDGAAFNTAEPARGRPACASEQFTTGALGAQVQRAGRAELRARSRARASAPRVAGASLRDRRPATPRPQRPVRPAQHKLGWHRQDHGHLHAPRRDRCGRYPIGGTGCRDARGDPHG